MKSIKIYILGMIFIVFSGCNDFLETEPLTDLTTSNFYQNQADAYTALVGVYDGLQVAYANGIAFPLASEVFSDNCFGATGASDGFGYQMIDEFDASRSPSDQNVFEGNWVGYYNALFRINSFLQYFDQIDWEGDDALRSQYEGEIRFIRAYIYFDMVRLWEKVPLLTEPSQDNIPQADPADIYKVIADDLVFAANNLPAEPYSSQAPETYGRVTKWAAEALIGRVFLFYTGYYGTSDLVGTVSKAQATAYLEDVINNGGFSLITNFADLWPAASMDNYAGEGNAETVFSIKYTYTSDYNGNTDGNHWMVMYGIREQSIYPYGNGWGGATVNPKLWNDFDDADERKVASITSIDDEGLPFENQDRQREYTGYYVKKYSPLSEEDGSSVAVNLGGVNFLIGQYQDYISIRYADVLLMAAELGSANAQDYYDEVRMRAGLATRTASTANIMEERKFEFAFEGIRYWDLLRQGINTAAGEIAEATTVLNAGVAADKIIQAANIVKTKGFQQIPNNQITLSSGVLVQNEGW